MSLMEAYFVVDRFNHGCSGRKYKNRREAVMDGAYQVWNENRIRRGFQFGCGTLEDLKRCCKDNNADILSPEEFYKILDTVPDREMHDSFIRRQMEF